VVWQDYRNGTADIYMYDLIHHSDKPIVAGDGEQEEPDIFDQFIVWQDNRNSGQYTFIVIPWLSRPETDLTSGVPAMRNTPA